MIYPLQRELPPASRGRGIWCESYALVADRLEGDEERAQLLSVSTKESGAWLRALPVSALGLRMDHDRQHCEGGCGLASG